MDYKKLAELFRNALTTKMADPDAEQIVQPTPTPTPIQKLINRLTYYLPTGGLTATGTVPKSGYTAAISRDMKGKINMGDLVKLPNGKIYRVEDLTNKRLQSTLDLFYDTPEQAEYPVKGRQLNTAYEIVGNDVSDMKYNYK